MSEDFVTKPDAPVVEVQVGQIDFTTDSDAKYDTGADPQAVWTDYFIETTYNKNTHIYMLGTTQPANLFPTNAPTVAFVQIANPTLCWKVDWTCSRWGEKPDLPSTAVGKDWILLDESLQPGIITLGPDGVNPNYRISGTYYFGNLRPNAKLSNDVSFTRPPFILNEFNRKVPESLFKKKLLNESNG